MLSNGSVALAPDNEPLPVVGADVPLPVLPIAAAVGEGGIITDGAGSAPRSPDMVACICSSSNFFFSSINAFLASSIIASLFFWEISPASATLGSATKDAPAEETVECAPVSAPDLVELIVEDNDFKSELDFLTSSITPNIAPPRNEFLLLPSIIGAGAGTTDDTGSTVTATGSTVAVVGISSTGGFLGGDGFEATILPFRDAGFVSMTIFSLGGVGFVSTGFAFRGVGFVSTGFALIGSSTGRVMPGSGFTAFFAGDTVAEPDFFETSTASSATVSV